MNIQYNYEGSCGTAGCMNYGVLIDVPSVDGVLQQVVCGPCGIQFTDRCVPK